MDTAVTQRNNRQVAIWLLIGVGMIIIQVLIGGITRLTESGLSITEWKPITGALPPTNDAAWQAEFDRYKVTDQFKYVHQSFTLSDFKFIFFWEWFHRLWARLLGVVFLIGFFYFLATKKFNKKMVPPMAILFLLGGLQGVIGWLMVKSGLVPEKYFVGHIELATHFIAALGLLAYTLWFALSLLVKPQQIVVNAALQKMMITILVVLIVQLFYGAFMAGLRAAASAPTWPDINGKIIPGMNELSPWAKNLTNNNIMVHFIHRGIAYLLFVLVVIWWIKSKLLTGNKLFSKLRSSLMMIVLLQVCLGIVTVLNATNSKVFVPFGVLHQAMAMLLLMCVVMILYVLRKRNVSIAAL